MCTNSSRPCESPALLEGVRNIRVDRHRANGAVAVAFYDRRRPCPNNPSILPGEVGKSNFCIDVSLQPFKDAGSGATPAGHNVRITNYSWDPQQPGQTVSGLPQLPCDDANCSIGFIGDYFGLAISAHNNYGLFVSTHYPSPDVAADNGGKVYYQQQVLATVPRTDFGKAFSSRRLRFRASESRACSIPDKRPPALWDETQKS
jgi:hypothetical protein